MSLVIRRRHFAMMRPAVVRVPVYIPYPQLGLLPRAYAIPSSVAPARANHPSSAELAGPTDNSNWVLPGTCSVVATSVLTRQVASSSADGLATLAKLFISPCCMRSLKQARKQLTGMNVSLTLS